MKKMKMFLTCIFALLLVFAMTETCFATVYVEKDLVLLEHVGDSVTLEVDFTGENTCSAYYDGGIKCEWNNMIIDTPYQTMQNFTITYNKNAMVGEYDIFLLGASTDSSEFIHLLVCDDTKLEIDNVTKKDGKVKVRWSEGQSGKYQLQYREADGSWKTGINLTDKTYWSTSKLKSGTKYEFRVRPVTESYWWGTQYGKWSNKFSYKVK